MTRLQNLSELDSNTKEGRYLLAALVKITTEGQTDKTPEEVLEQLYQLQDVMFKDAFDIQDDAIHEQPTFEKELQILLNRYSKENESNTPDFILRDFLTNALSLWNIAILAREDFYGKKMSINGESDLLK